MSKIVDVDFFNNIHTIELNFDNEILEKGKQQDFSLLELIISKLTKNTEIIFNAR